MIKFIKYLVVIIIVLFITIPFAGSYSVQSIDDLAYLVALGIDMGKNNNYTITFQFTKPTASGESAGSQTAPTITNSIDASSLDSAINLMNTYVSKEINLSHCKVIVISEEIASDGIASLLYSLMNKTQIRPNCNIIVSKSTAKDFIKNVQPSLENLIAKFYEISPTSGEYTGYTGDIKLGDFFNHYSCITCQPVAMLGFIDYKDATSPNNFSSEDNNNNSGDGSSSGGSNGGGSGSGEQSSQTTGSSEVMGLAVFKEDKLVGELSPEETLYHLLIQNKLESCHISIPRSEAQETPIDLYVYNRKKPKMELELVNGTPFIHLDMNLEAKVLSADATSSNISEAALKEYEVSANQYIKKKIEHYLYRTSTELQSDIDGFGRHTLSKFSTLKEFKDYNWLENYKNTFFDVKVTTNVQSAFLLSGK